MDKSEITSRTKHVEDIIVKYLPKEEGLQKTVIEAMNYSFLAGGKRLRPMLMEEAYKMFHGWDEAIEPFMAAMEMLHTSSLIHDDLPAMDNDMYRRGKKTNHAVYGEAMAILAGDALILYAFETAAKAFSIREGGTEVGRAMSVFASKAGIYGMVGGQTLDVEMDGKQLTRQQLGFIHHLKTGALIESSMMIGAILAEAGEENIRKMEAIASKVGLAFQIQDDILDVVGDSKELGKSAGSDEKNKKTTYVTLYGLEKARGDVKALTDEAIGIFDSLEEKNDFLRELLISLVSRNK